MVLSHSSDWLELVSCGIKHFNEQKKTLQCITYFVVCCLLRSLYLLMIAVQVSSVTNRAVSTPTNTPSTLTPTASVAGGCVEQFCIVCSMVLLIMVWATWSCDLHTTRFIMWLQWWTGVHVDMLVLSVQFLIRAVPGLNQPSVTVASNICTSKWMN